jgi:hypothetical protein
LPIAAKHNLAIAMKLGAERQINPELKTAGKALYSISFSFGFLTIYRIKKKYEKATA